MHAHKPTVGFVLCAGRDGRDAKESAGMDRLCSDHLDAGSSIKLDIPKEIGAAEVTIHPAIHHHIL